MGVRFKECRTACGITQQELAASLGVTQKTISNWEVSKTFPSFDQLMALAHLLRCTPNDLLGWVDLPDTTHLSRDTDAQVLSCWHQLDGENQELVARVVLALLATQSES